MGWINYVNITMKLAMCPINEMQPVKICDPPLCEPLQKLKSSGCVVALYMHVQPVRQRCNDGYVF